MATTNQDFIIYAGDSKYIVAKMTKEDGTDLSLVGASAKWGVRKAEHSPLNAFLKTSPNDITFNGNVATVKIVPDDTKFLEPGNYYHEFELTDSLGNVSTMFVGKMTIKRSGV